MSVADALVQPLDRMRSGVLRTLGRPGRVLLANRGVRVAVYAGMGVVTAAFMAFVSPLLAFFLGPVLFGVPHLLSDVRYLVVQPGLHRRRALAWSVGIPLFLATVVQSPAIGLAGGFGAIVFSRGAAWRRTVLALAWAGVVLLAATHSSVATLVVLHGHNALAVVLFALAFARSRVVGVGVVVVMAAMTTAILFGGFDAVFARAFLRGDPSPVLDVVAPAGLFSPMVAVRLAVLFVFAQSFHYVLWLRVIPEDARPREGIRSFASSLNVLELELGKIVLLVFVAFGVLVLAKAALVSLDAARVIYLRGATFHAYLELAFALLLLSGEKRG